MPKKILVVDDDPLVVKTVAKYLKTCGYDTEIAQSGQEALQKTAESAFDLIISDIRMPGMDGIETLKEIRESSLQHNKEKTPAVIITGYAGGDEIYRQAGELGIAECIYKPFELEKFIGIIRKTLELPPKYKKEITLDYKILDNRFVSLTKEMEGFLRKVKTDCDEFDKLNKNEQKQIEFIRSLKKDVFIKLDDYFAKIWDIVKNLEKDIYIIYQNYFQQVLGYLLLEPIATNRHVYEKPLGYAGDYKMMNYIYDYNGNENYLGISTYEKLINNYTCNIPISCSNINRKEYLKEKIIKTLRRVNKPKILSIACGPARELIELVREGKIISPLLYKCLDFERKALEHIEGEIKKIELKNKQLLSIEYICRDITGIIRDKALKEKLKNQDLIYAFGIFDYLNCRMASRLIKELLQLLQGKGELIICNASLENSSHRAYYELLGEWNMVYRTKEEMLLWIKDISDIGETKLEYSTEVNNYLFLSIKKL